MNKITVRCITASCMHIKYNQIYTGTRVIIEGVSYFSIPQTGFLYRFGVHVEMCAPDLTPLVGV